MAPSVLTLETVDSQMDSLKGKDQVDLRACSRLGLFQVTHPPHIQGR